MSGGREKIRACVLLCVRVCVCMYVWWKCDECEKVEKSERDKVG